MTPAIQQTYYLRSLNPSDTETLLSLADELSLDRAKFAYLLAREEVNEQLLDEIGEARAIQASSFPSLILRADYATYRTIPINYTDAQSMVDTIESLIAAMR